MTGNALQGRRIALTGATGMIGRALVRRLLDDGALVRAGSRQSRPDGLDARVEWRMGDVADRAWCEAFLQGADELWHAASFRKNAPYHLSHAEEVRERNLAMTAALLGAVEARGGALAVTVFSTGNIPPDFSLGDPASRADGYVSGKAASDVLWLAARLGGTPLILRPCTVYGPGDPPAADGNVIPALLWKAGHDPVLRVWGTPEQSRYVAFLPDMIEAIWRLRAAGATGIQYVRPPEPVSFGALAETIVSVVRPGLPVAFDAGQAHGPLSPPVTPVHPALASLPWTPLADGLRATVESF